MTCRAAKALFEGHGLRHKDKMKISKLQIMSACFALSHTGSAFAADPVRAIPLGNPGEWVTADDYPATSLRNAVEGTVGFKVTIGEDGVTKACEIFRSSGSAELDEQTCRLVKERAKFRPATDVNGNAMAGSYSNSVRWKLPTIEPETVTPYKNTLTFTILENGHASECTVVSEGNLPSAQRNQPTPCDVGVQMFKPFFDATGKPVSRRVRVATTVEFLDGE